eukprot:4809628-Pleurochrysis_carterae.AAC.4
MLRHQTGHGLLFRSTGQRADRHRTRTVAALSSAAHQPTRAACCNCHRRVECPPATQLTSCVLASMQRLYMRRLPRVRLRDLAPHRLPRLPGLLRNQQDGCGCWVGIAVAARRGANCVDCSAVAATSAPAAEATEAAASTITAASTVTTVAFTGYGSSAPLTTRV